MASKTPLETYREQGFVVIEDLIEPETISALSAELTRICRGELGIPSIEPAKPWESDAEVLGRFLCIHQPHKASQALRETIRHPALIGVLQQLIGPDVKCMQSQYFVKPPDYPGNAWHQDEIAIPTRDRSLCAAFIAIDDATVENGCLRVLPGSHLSGYLYPQEEHAQLDEYDFPTVSRGFDDSGQVPVELRSGSVVFFHGYLLHGSRSNRSRSFRRALTYHYMNAFSLLPWRLLVQEGEVAARDGEHDFRDVVLACGRDPYAWKGYEEKSTVHLRPCKKMNDIRAVPSARRDREEAPRRGTL